jgi:KaiC/GvpD/RAD55 family RecA-like ATPase
LIAYHGSAEPISSFDLHRSIGIADPKLHRLFFTTNPKMARRYAQMAVRMRRGKAPFITTVKLSLDASALITDVSNGQDIAIADPAKVTVLSSEQTDMKFESIS